MISKGNVAQDEVREAVKGQRTEALEAPKSVYFCQSSGNSLDFEAGRNMICSHWRRVEAGE